MTSEKTPQDDKLDEETHARLMKNIASIASYDKLMKHDAAQRQLISELEAKISYLEYDLKLAEDRLDNSTTLGYSTSVLCLENQKLKDKIKATEKSRSMTQGFELTTGSASSYEVHHFDEGVVFASHDGFPISCLEGMGALVKGPDDEKLIVPSLQTYYSRVLERRFIYAIATNKKTLVQWEDRVSEHIESMHINLIEKWLIGLDVGTSSRTMVMMAFPEEYERSDRWYIGKGQDIPYDHHDFGRCLRVVDLFCSRMSSEIQDVRKRFLDPDRYPTDVRWRRIVNNWDRLSSIAREAGLSNRRGSLVEDKCKMLCDELKSSIESP